MKEPPLSRRPLSNPNPNPPPPMASSPNHTLNGDSNTHASKKPKLSFITSSKIAAEFSHHDPNVARINNDSFGSCPDSIIQAHRCW
ncbi:hypothetical protein RchiOBHm_Chr4g0390731 [Rosa chinensis]|uniref:Uncharacterized protein n=1 Tax=Rosa chinensis TaxID=74649 RepID=A0A2P6QQA3_ROSCH|nr:hypothetical protein RchiOBHm_Chr4g0390731 [Rosa chinensis]